jgi:hypothetical protein
MRTTSWGLAVLFGMGLVLGLAARADEEKVPLDKVPKTVLDAVKKKFDGAEVKGASKEKADGKEVFEVTIKFKDANIDVTVTPEGKIELVEKEIPAKELPRAVAEALDKKYPKATIKLAEAISKDDDKVFKFEMVIVTGDKKTLEVCFDPDGKFLTEEVKKDDKDEKDKNEKDKDEKDKNEKDKKKDKDEKDKKEKDK